MKDPFFGEREVSVRERKRKKVSRPSVPNSIKLIVRQTPGDGVSEKREETDFRNMHEVATNANRMPGNALEPRIEVLCKLDILRRCQFSTSKVAMIRLERTAQNIANRLTGGFHDVDVS